MVNSKLHLPLNNPLKTIIRSRRSVSNNQYVDICGHCAAKLTPPIDTSPYYRRPMIFIAPLATYADALRQHFAQIPRQVS